MIFFLGVHAPGVKEHATAPYKCAHNVLKCHARAYRLYERTYKSTQNGFVGITIDSGWYVPLDPNNALDVAATERTLQFKVNVKIKEINFGIVKMNQ